MKKRLNSIQTKLIMAFLIPVLFIILLGVISYTQASTGLVESYKASTFSTMSYMAKYLNFGLETAADKVVSLQNNQTMTSFYSGAYKNDPTEEKKRYSEIIASVSQDILNSNYIANVYIFSNYGAGFSGNAIDSSKLVYSDYAANGEGATLEENNGILWLGSHSYLDQISGGDESKYGISYISNFYNILGKPAGCVVLDIKYNYIYDTISQSGFPEGSALAFITNDGREITYGSVPEKYKFTDQDYYKKAVKDLKTESGSQYITINNQKYLFVFSKVDNSQSMLCSIIPNSVIVAQASKLKFITILLVILASVIAIALGTVIAYGFSNTIHKIIQILQKTKIGDLTAFTNVKRKDEFLILGKSINDVIGNIQNLIRKMSGTSASVTQSAAIVSDTSGILVTATQNISNAVSDIEQGVTQQAVDAENCLLLMAGLAEKINGLYDGIHNIEEIAKGTETIVGNGITAVETLGIKAKDTTMVTKTVIEDIENLAIESKAISGIIETINEIAQETNLLSLNASIEAARAGEAGRGFSVVASEIRKLADQSLKASDEIAIIIQRIENQTEKTVNTARYSESIVISQEGALESTVNSFENINKHVETLTGSLEQIVSGVEGIEQAKNETLRAIESISATSQETAAATEELSVTADKQLREVNKLNDVVNQLNENAESLQEAVRLFKIN